MKEFDFIDRLKKNSIQSPAGIGDDAAFSDGFLIAKDIMAEGIHFTHDEAVGNEALFAVIDRLFASNVSDIAAMGGVGGKYKGLLGVAIPDYVDKNVLLGAISLAAAKYGLTLIGGDTVSSAGGLFLSLTIIGTPNKNVLTRNGAGAGDKVYLSRPTGGAKYRLEKRLGRLIGFPAMCFSSGPEMELGDELGKTSGITGCIDISDGLGRDLAHIAHESGVKIVIDRKLLPVFDLPLSEDERLEYALSSGEEYALLFTAAAEITSIKGRKVYKIGAVEQGAGCFLHDNGVLTDISNIGYEHT